MAVHVDKDLFGESVREKPKKKKLPTPVVLPEASARSSWSPTKRWLRRFTGDTAHQMAVNVAAYVLTALILAGAAQWKWNWIGRSQGQIGEWTTTVEPGE